MFRRAFVSEIPISKMVSFSRIRNLRNKPKTDPLLKVSFCLEVEVLAGNINISNKQARTGGIIMAILFFPNECRLASNLLSYLSLLEGVFFLGGPDSMPGEVLESSSFPCSWGTLDLICILRPETYRAPPAHSVFVSLCLGPLGILLTFL